MRFIINVVIYLLYCIGGIGLSPSAFASDVIRLAASEIPLFVESSEKGLFVELTHEISRRTGLAIEILVLPALRVEKNLILGRL